MKCIQFTPLASAWALAGLLTACAAPSSETPSAGAAAIQLPQDTFGQPADAMPDVLVSPSGEIIVPGTVDELGWVLPLDVKRPRPERPPGERPSQATIGARRAALGPPLFPNVRLGPDDGHTQNETSIDVEGNVLVAGWNQFTDTSAVMGAARSVDRGRSWSFELFGGHNVMSDPAVAAGGDGRWYFAYLAIGGAGGSDAEIYVRRSLDAGATWQAPVPVTANTTFDDKPYIAARGLEVLVAWADFAFSPAKVRAARSLDGGLTFGANTILAVNSVAGNAACPLIGPDGTYYVFWRDSFQDFFWMSRSTNQGTTWSADAAIVEMNPLPSTLPPGFRTLNAPTCAVDPTSGDLLVVWNDQLFGNPDVLAIRSDDGGDTWSVPVLINDDGGAVAQLFPWVSFDDAGIAHAIWYDRRHHATNLDVYYAQSADGGATWAANVRLTAQGFTPILPWEAGAANFIGDYNGIAATGGRVYPFFQDSREGNQDVWVALLPAPQSLLEDGFESGDLSAWTLYEGG